MKLSCILQIINKKKSEAYSKRVKITHHEDNHMQRHLTCKERKAWLVLSNHKVNMYSTHFNHTHLW